MRRRQVLGATASVATIGLAGCFGNAKTDNPRAVVRAYLEAEYDDGDPEAMAKLLHSDSPLNPTKNDEGIESSSVQIDSLTIGQRDLSAEEIQSQNMRLGAETAESIGGIENALVSAKYETESPELPGSNVESGGPSGKITVQTTYLTATENDDWLVVAFRVL
jgi:hypothetical protein